MTDDAFLARFEAGTPQSFDHRDHVRVAFATRAAVGSSTPSTARDGGCATSPPRTTSPSATTRH